MGTRSRISSPSRPKQAKQVTGNANKIKKLAELKKVNIKIDQFHNKQQKDFEKNQKMFNKSRKLRQQLGID